MNRFTMRSWLRFVERTSIQMSGTRFERSLLGTQDLVGHDEDVGLQDATGPKPDIPRRAANRDGTGERPRPDRQGDLETTRQALMVAGRRRTDDDLPVDELDLFERLGEREESASVMRPAGA